MIRVLIVDDHAVVRKGMHLIAGGDRTFAFAARRVTTAN